MAPKRNHLHLMNWFAGKMFGIALLLMESVSVVELDSCAFVEEGALYEFEGPGVDDSTSLTDVLEISVDV